MAPLHGGSSAGKSGLCCDLLVRRGGPSGFAPTRSYVFSALFGCFSPGPRRNDLMIYWAFGPFVRSFTPLVDPGDIYPPQAALTDQRDFFLFFIIIKYTDSSQCTDTPIGINLRKDTPIGFNLRKDTPIGINLRKDLCWNFITSQSRRTCILVQA
jgi:hypothetical protein